MDDKKLLAEAKQVMQKAYAPYSHLKVGAAILGPEGRICPGCNVENASYGLTVCAERVAVGKAVSEGITAFRAIALIADTDDPITPCGACRQVLSEFNPEMIVIMGNLRGAVRKAVLSDLLPGSFQPNVLK